MESKKSNNEKTFSSANLFFLCTISIILFGYYYYGWKRIKLVNPGTANAIFIIMILAISFWLLVKFPLFVKKHSDTLTYDEVHSKKINLLSKIYSGLVNWTVPCQYVSFFTNMTLSAGIKNRDCSLALNEDPVKPRHRVCDLILTIFSCLLMLFITPEFSKVGILFGFISFALSMLFFFRNLILSRIFSVNIGLYKSYNLSIMYQYGFVNNFTPSQYGFANCLKNDILISQKVFSGGETLKQYILAHEEGHLKTVNRKKSIAILSVFLSFTFLFFLSEGILVQLGIENVMIILIPLALYLVFLIIISLISLSYCKRNEILADVYAIKKIGKEAVFDGLSAIVNDNKFSKNLNISGISVNRRLEFVKTFEK